MSLLPSVPKTFLPLLLFIGFFVILIGMGFYTTTSNPNMITNGFAIMTVAVLLFILMNRRKMRG